MCPHGLVLSSHAITLHPLFQCSLRTIQGLQIAVDKAHDAGGIICGNLDALYSLAEVQRRA